MRKVISSTVIFAFVVFLLSGCSGSKDVAPSVTGLVSKELGMTKSQTEAGMGALMMMSKDKLSPEDFTKLAKDIPGANSMMKKATDLGAIPGSIGSTADILQLLSKLGVSPVTAAKFIPTVLNVTKELGGGAFGLLSKVF